MAEKTKKKFCIDSDVSAALEVMAKSSAFGWSVSRLVNEALRKMLERHKFLGEKFDRAAFDKMTRKSPPFTAGEKIKYNRR
jgi:hypothetical protein